MTFPLSLSAAPLGGGDVSRFATLFSKILSEFFPCRCVKLFSVPFKRADAVGLASVCCDLAAQAEVGKPSATVDNGEYFLCMPLWSADVPVGLTILEGVGPEVADASNEWLTEQSFLVSRELQLVKQSCLDSVTGLFNGYHLHSEIEILLASAFSEIKGEAGALPSLATSLAFLEVYPRGRDADRGLEYIVRAGTYLSSLLGQSVPLHHLGAGVFSLLWYGASSEDGRKLGDVLLRRLKRENFSSAHLGITSVIPADAGQSATAEQVVEQAWQALRKARKRGPFSLFSHATQQEIEAHPLRKDSPSTLAWLRRLWRGKDKFALVFVRQDQEAVSNHFSKRLRSAVGLDVPLLCVNQREAYLFLEGSAEKEALAWVTQFKEKMTALGGSTFSTGVALYPCVDYRKTEIPKNCRKAMLHAGFYGPGAQAVFDAVSLNISGDVYYNEGDLRHAVREYRKGLSMSPENLNLLNSLGVAYVQLNRPGMAVPVFERVLAVDDKNFMALSNLGFVLLHKKDDEGAIKFFERALLADGTHFDLLLHLGRLYCQQKRYHKAVEVLERCLNRQNDSGLKDGDYGTVYRLLGVAYEALGDFRQAISCLERATGLNARDAEALSRLGSLYCFGKQGDDIALSLCRQAVEIESSCSDHWYRLGRVLAELGHDLEAVESLRDCLKIDRQNAEAVFLLARLLQKTDKKKQARVMYERVLRLEPQNREAREALSSLS